MGKEAKIGLVILGLLLIVLAGSVWWRFARWQRNRIAEKEQPAARPMAPSDPRDSQSASSKNHPVASAVPIRAVPLETAIRVPNRSEGWNAPDPSGAPLPAAAPMPDRGAAAPLGAMPAFPAPPPNEPGRSHPLAIEVQPAEELPAGPGPGPDYPMPAGLEPEVVPVQATEPLHAPPDGQQHPPEPAPGATDPFARRSAAGAAAALGDRYPAEPAPIPEAVPQEWNTPGSEPLPDPGAYATPRASSIYQSRQGQAPPIAMQQRGSGDLGAASNLRGMPPERVSVPMAGMPAGLPPGMDNAGGLRADGTYQVEPNDNYWRICEKFYGTGAYFKALAEHNRKRIAHSDRLQVGDLIEIPAEADLQANYGDLCPKLTHLTTGRSGAIPASYVPGGRAYVVEEGDTLFDIARHELGAPSRWKEIYDLNRDQLSEDFNHLRPGTQLTLPPDGSSSQQPAATLTRRPGGAVY